MQGYNAQAAVTDGQIIVAAEITTDPAGLRAARADARRRAAASWRQAGVTERPVTVLADAGYWHSEQIERIVGDGIAGADPARQRATRRRHGRAGKAASMTSCAGCSPPTTAASSTPSAKLSIEPVFGQIKHNRRIDHFKRRGRAAVRSEWRLIAASHNLLKLHNKLTAPAIG